jgi:hypothetical protein
VASNHDTRFERRYLRGAADSGRVAAKAPGRRLQTVSWNGRGARPQFWRLLTTVMRDGLRGLFEKQPDMAVVRGRDERGSIPVLAAAPRKAEGARSSICSEFLRPAGNHGLRVTFRAFSGHQS